MTATIEDVLAGRARWTVEEGDCLAVMDAIPDRSVDMILCDLPYGTTACKWDVMIPFEPLWKQYKRVIKRNGAIVLTASQPFTSALVMSNPKWFKCEWIWEKNVGSNWGSIRFMPMKEHESILVFGQGRTTYNPIPAERVEGGKSRIKYNIFRDRSPKYGEVYGNSFKNQLITEHSEKRCPRSIIRFNREMGLHPTQKPVALMEYLIKTYSNEGELILDNCSGSGSTGVAALNTGRFFIGIEKESPYVNLSRERLQAEEQKARQLEFAA